MRQLSARAFSVFGCLMDDPLASITAIQISRSLGVSERTVRYAVNELSTWLAEQNISLKRVPHKGFSFEAQDAARAAELFAELKNSLSSSARNLTTDQRVQAILYSLLMQTCPHSLEEIAQSTGVSRTTAVRDMKQACSWFSERHVTVSHDAKKGWDIVADEAQRRFLLMNLIDASISSSSNTAEDRGSHRTLETPFVPFNEHDLEYVACTLQKNLAERNLAVTDASFLNLATYLTLTQCRVRDNHWLTSSSLEADNENRTFDLLAKQLWETFALGGTSQQAHLEQKMISMLLEASSKTSAESAEKLRPDISERILDIFLTEVSEKVGYDLYLDQECVHGLRAHFAALTVRNRLGLEIKNDMLPEIQTRFSNLFALCKDVLRNIQLAYGLTATDDETGFLVLYLAAILEKAQPAPSGSRTIRVALVCGAGIGTVAYLSRSLAKEFPRLEICAKLPAREIESFDFQNIDLVLTTVSLDVVITRPVIRVTPTLTKNDVRNIESFLRLPSAHSPEKLLNDVFAVIDSTCTIHEKETLTKQLQALLGVDAPKPKASIPGFIRLKDLVRKEQIKTHRPVKSWNEAVALAARPLLDQGWMTLDYYNEILDLSVRYEQFGVILAPLCAPHANADVRNHPCISIVTTKEPVTVSMGSVEMPIRVVMLLCLQTPVSLSSALDELFRLVDEEPNFITDLIEATTATKLQHVLEGYCERMDKR